jgi:hypothetical protein
MVGFHKRFLAGGLFSLVLFVILAKAGIQLKNFLIQIFPLRIILFNQSYFPCPVPLFQLLLSWYRTVNICCLLKMYQEMNLILFCKSFFSIMFVFVDSSYKVICNTNIECSILFAG